MNWNEMEDMTKIFWIALIAIPLFLILVKLLRRKK